MPEIRDPAIKLFGKMIACHAAESGGGGGGEEEENKGHLTSMDREQESPDSKESSEPAVSSSEYDQGNHSSSDDQETAPENNSKPQEEEEDDDEEEHNDSSNPILKKPDKILPCPRCNSLETKFCYYNNYNVNQPRHFCKNCQRYWTAGGTMRNVPVGAGRRKNKNSVASSLYHHLTVSDVGLHAIPEHIHRPPLDSNGTVLSFGSDAPFGNTMASALNLPEKQMISCHRKGVHPAEEHMEEQSSLSPVTQDCQSFSSTNVPCQFPWTPPPPPPAALCASSYPMPFYPAAAAYWGYSPWGLPWLSSLASPSPFSRWSVSGADCPALGKHSREEDAVPGDSSSSERRRLWIPKTLRIHDPEEAAKSSIWASMGFKSDDGQGFFETFQTKGELSRTHLGEASSRALHANPAALSRSINFLESS